MPARNRRREEKKRASHQHTLQAITGGQSTSDEQPAKIVEIAPQEAINTELECAEITEEPEVAAVVPYGGGYYKNRINSFNWPMMANYRLVRNKKW